MNTLFTLQFLIYYGESGLLGVETAPIMGALIDKFDDEYSNTLVLGEGDSYIPGPWLVGGSDPSLNSVPGIGTTALGRPDIAIMNAFGTDASALGNHEFDLGSPVLQAAIAASGTGASAWAGAQFPLVTTNLNFAADSSLRGLADASLGGTATNAFAGQEASAIKGKIAPYTIVTQGGEKIGIVGATTYDLLTKTSPNGTVPKDDGIATTSDLQEVAAYLQTAIDALKATGINKIVLVDQLDTIERNKQLAPLVSGIDVMVAGGGHERLGDANDKAVGFNGHSADFVGTFPIVTAGKDGKPTLIVTTDTEYSYLGRLVVDFDANGEIVVPNLNSTINGAYASTQATLQSAYNSTQTAKQIVAGSEIGAKVDAITSAINSVIIAKDGNIFGYTNVYIEGDRAFGRAQEVNFGNISADANIFKTRAVLGNGAIIASLKNGGGLRASVGSIGETGTKLPPTASTVKPTGAISQLDVENALRFDNKLMVFDTTPSGLLAILNYAAGLAPGNGGFAQVGGVRFSYDSTKPVGNTVQDVAIYDLDDKLVAKVVDNGVVLASAPAKISVVTLNFTANGGDGYPIKANADNFRYLLNNGTLSAPVDKALDFTAVANLPATALGEQKAFEDYLKAVHGTPQKAYNVADTPATQDQRIQNLQVKAQDTIFPLTIGTKAQSLTQRTLDLTDYAGKALKVDTKTQGDAAYDNNVGFYAVEDSIGTIKLANGVTLKPGDANYALEAIKSAILGAGKIDSKLDRDLIGGKIYAPVVVAQGSLTDFVSKNPTNGGDGTVIHAYFNYLGANPDKFDHFKLIGDNTFAVEDQFGGGDKDFNDLIVSMNFKTV
jgi:2',3'-cyclic-nucleotide 2'-phosphodiesterase (5'-nucleotidase family)